MLSRANQPVYASGECEIDLDRREFRVRGVPAPIGGRAFEIIELLVRSAGELVTKDELMDRVWPGAIVLDNTLQVHISAVRKVLGPRRTLLKTESGRGYRLLGEWTHREQAAAPRPLLDVPPITEPAAAATNLPMFITPLIGRSTATELLRDLVSAYRVVTLTGPGGIGKTTLALHVARDLLPEFADGGWLVELASLSDPKLVPSAVVNALQLNLGGGEISAAAIARTISDKKSLLILDNCEHVIDAAASFAETLVRSCPRVTILATSRELLRIDGEHVYRVAPLDVPAQDELPDVLDHSAIELFITRVRSLDSHFSPNADSVPLITAICRHLDGIPLAIEFAAARAATFGIELVASGLRDRFTLLTSGRRTALPRHRTLRATLDWSYDLLPEAERQLLCRLAVFPAGFTLDAAVAVIGGDAAANPSAVTDGIVNLADKSLVTSERSGPSGRWRLLETVRAYALEKLDAVGERELFALRHAEYCRDVLERAELEGESRPTAEWLADYAWHIDDVRAALDWAFSPGGNAAIGVALTAAAVPLWLHLSLVVECRERCDRALRIDHIPDARLRMRLQIGLGNSLLHTRGPSEQAQTVLAEALQSAEALGDLHAQLRVLLDLSSVDGFRGEYTSAAAASERAGVIAQQIGDTTGVTFADRRMGMILLRTGRLMEAQRYFERVIQSVPFYPAEDPLPIWRRLDDRAMARALLARTLWLQGFSEKAHHEGQASIAEVRGADHQLTMCRVLFYGIGRIAPMTGDFAAAETAISSMIDSATSAAAPFWTTAGQLLRGKLLVERREFAEGLAVLRDAFDICERTGWQISYPEFMGSFALALLGIGQLDEAHDAVCKAIDAAGEGEDGQQWYVPELLRIKGEVLLGQSSNRAVQAAEACFDQAMEMAREQGAVFWELRAALSAASLRVRQKNQSGAAQVLQPVFDRLTEGFDTLDPRAAKLLLDGL
jgi:predicted ATPase/DNA-binding winged helix-turn-helix (wHTH) protein